MLTNVEVLKRTYGKSYLVQGESIETGSKIKCFLHQNHIAAAVKYKEGDKKSRKDVLEAKSKGEFEVGETLKCNIRIKEFNFFVCFIFFVSVINEFMMKILNRNGILKFNIGEIIM